MPRWGTADAEIKVLSAENPERMKVLSFKEGLLYVRMQPCMLRLPSEVYPNFCPVYPCLEVTVWGRQDVGIHLRANLLHSVFLLCFSPSILFLLIVIYPLTTRVVLAPHMISQPVPSIFPCSPLPSWTWRKTPGLSIPWCCLPTSTFVCLAFFPLSSCLSRWFWTDLMNPPQKQNDVRCAQCFRPCLWLDDLQGRRDVRNVKIHPIVLSPLSVVCYRHVKQPDHQNKLSRRGLKV